MCSLEKRGKIYLLTLTGQNEHRLNPNLLGQIRSALAQIKSAHATSASPAALVTAGEGKFFSNGYDLDWASEETPIFRAQKMDSELRSLIADLADLPIPTVAAVTGHASAAGLILALGHDHVVARRDRGFMYMSEVDIGLRIPSWFVALVKCRVGAPPARRRILMEAAKLTGPEAVEYGIADSAHDGAEATLAAAISTAERLAARGWDGEVYAHTRSELLSDVLAEIRAGVSLSLDSKL